MPLYLYHSYLRLGRQNADMVFVCLAHSPEQARAKAYLHFLLAIRGAQVLMREEGSAVPIWIATFPEAEAVEVL